MRIGNLSLTRRSTCKTYLYHHLIPIAMKIKEKIVENLLELSLEKGISFITLIFGISSLSVWGVTKWLLNYTVQISLGVFLVCLLTELFLILVIIYVRKKLGSKRKFQEGKQVILSTLHLPVMTAGKYNFLNNTIQCTWSDKEGIKSNWINQNQLVEYTPPSYSSINRTTSRNKGYWDGY